jgi:protein-disulfide isomerase
MKLFPAAQKPVVFMLLGAGAATAFFLTKEKWKTENALISNALCFLKDAPETKPIAQFENIPLTKENLPADLYTAYLDIENENYKRMEDLGRQMALRLDAMGTTQGKRDPRNAPPLSDVLKKGITDQDTLEFYNNNPKPFAGAKYEQVKDLIKNMLQNRQDKLLVQSKIQSMEKDNRFHMLLSAPCGAETNIPYSNTLPGRGNTTAKMNLLVTFNFDCSQCRAVANELKQFSNQNLDKFRLWLMPVPGAQGSRNYHFAALFQCAFENDPANIVTFYEKIFDLPFARDPKSDGRKELVELAGKSGLDSAKAEKCLNDKGIEKTLASYSKMAAEHQIDGQTPRYFLNERGMAPDLGVDLIKTMKVVLSERERLREAL